MFTKLSHVALAPYILNVVLSQDAQSSAVVKLSSDSVYSGQLVTLTCNYESQKTLTDVSVDAFNGSHKVGFLSCNIRKNSTIATGVFSGKSFDGCPAVRSGSSSVKVTMSASPSFDLLYNCTASFFGDNGFVAATSEFVKLEVFVIPSKPEFSFGSIAFSEKGNVQIICKSYGGKPSAAVNVTIMNSKRKFNSFSGAHFASLVLPAPLTDWHNTTAECAVTNHNFSNMTVKSLITVNYIDYTHEPSNYCLFSRNLSRDCLAPISSHRGINNSLLISSETDSEGLSRLLFNCIAATTSTINITVVAFLGNESSCANNVTSTTGDRRPFFFCVYDEHSVICYAVGVPIAVVVVTAIILSILSKQGLFSTRRLLLCSCLRTTTRAHAIVTACNEEIDMTENTIYIRLPVSSSGEDAGPSCYRSPTHCEGSGNCDDNQNAGHHLAEGDRLLLAPIYEEIGVPADRPHSQTPKNGDTVLLPGAKDVS